MSYQRTLQQRWVKVVALQHNGPPDGVYDLVTESSASDTPDGDRRLSGQRHLDFHDEAAGGAVLRPRPGRRSPRCCGGRSTGRCRHGRRSPPPRRRRCRAPAGGSRTGARRCARDRPAGTPGPSSTMVRSAHPPVAAQRHADAAALGRDADGVVDDVLDHRLQQVLAGAHDDVVLELGAELEAAALDHACRRPPSCASAGAKGRPAGAADRAARPSPRPCGGPSDTSWSRRSIEFSSTAMARRAAGLAGRHDALQGLQRLPHDRDRGLDGVGVVLGGVADAVGRGAQGLDQAVELLGHAGQLDQLVLRAERAVAGVARCGGRAPARRNRRTPRRTLRKTQRVSTAITR